MKVTRVSVTALANHNAIPDNFGRPQMSKRQLRTSGFVSCLRLVLPSAFCISHIYEPALGQPIC